jgi:AraC-like DNA-binding protein
MVKWQHIKLFSVEFWFIQVRDKKISLQVITLTIQNSFDDLICVNKYQTLYNLIPRHLRISFTYLTGLNKSSQNN